MNTRKRHLCVLLGTVLALLTTGCHVRDLAATYAATFGAGWLLGSRTVPMTTEIQCFRNGQPIDCAELPQ